MSEFFLLESLILRNQSITFTRNVCMFFHSISSLFLRQKSDELVYWKHTALTIGLMALVTVIVLLLLNIGLASGAVFGLILDLTGGIGGMG